MLTEQQFRDELRIFVEKMNENNFNWKLIENGNSARETHLVELPNGGSVSHDSHIIYNTTYKVPTLWFNFFAKNGTPISIESVERDLLKIPETEETSSIRTRISQYEHPYMGVLYYNIHPCQTSEVMKELKTDGTYFMSWMSAYGQQIGLKIPDLRKLKS